MLSEGVFALLLITAPLADTLFSRLFYTQFKAACLKILHGPFLAIFTDLVPMLVFIEVTGKISIDFN